MVKANFYRCAIENSEQPVLIRYDQTMVGMFETIGGKRARYKVLEDALISFTAPRFKDLSVEDQAEVLKETVAILQEKCGQTRQGSTLNGTFVWVSDQSVHTVTANVGDSISFLLILDENKRPKLLEVLNDFHLAASPSLKERQRIATEQHAVLRNGRLDLGYVSLALTRAIGDNEFFPALSHEAEIHINNFVLGENDLVYLIVACDGLTENNAVTKAQIANMVSKWHGEPAIAAFELVKEAIKISTDNVSVAVIANVSNFPIAAFVFDGHGGRNVADKLGDHFYHIFSKVLEHRLRSR